MQQVGVSQTNKPKRKKTGGRQKGTRNKRSVDRLRFNAITAEGLLPLDYMLAVMRDPNAGSARRDDMAKAAAPYVHAKLATIAHTGPDGNRMVIEVIHHVVNAAEKVIDLEPNDIPQFLEHKRDSGQ